MLDIKFIRNNLDVVKDGARKKHVEIDLDKLVQLDDERLKLLKEVEELRSEQGQKGENIQNLPGEEKETLLNELKGIKENLKTKEEEYKKVLAQWTEIMLLVPNTPDISVPEGEDESDNVELKTVGHKPNFDFQPKDHMELMKGLDMADFERGSKVHGFRGYFLKGDGALLSWAIWNYAKDFFLEKGFNPFLPPAIVKSDFFYNTGHLPNDAEDLYETQDGDYLSGTSEVPMMAYHDGEIFDKNELPKRYLAFSPCYRREAGSYGKDTKGLVRVHEFYKWEQLVLCEANHDESVRIHEELTNNIEEFVGSMEIPYRRLAICTGDLKSAHVKSYDTELWVPSENQYREIGSSSYYHDFQSRRFNIRYNDDDGKKQYAHSLNATAIPTPRILVALVENFQDKEGNIHIPKALQKYFGKEKITK